MQRLADERLVVTDRDPAGRETAEVVHEALIQRWPRLRSRMDEDREFRVWQERLRDAVHIWQASNQDSGALLRGAPLTEAESWLQQRPDDLSANEQDFIHISRTFQGRTVRRLRALVTALSVLLLASAGLGIRAKQEGDHPKRQSRRASSLYLASQAGANAARYPDRSKIMSVQALGWTTRARRETACSGSLIATTMPRDYSPPTKTSKPSHLTPTEACSRPALPMVS